MHFTSHIKQLYQSLVYFAADWNLRHAVKIKVRSQMTSMLGTVVAERVCSNPLFMSKLIPCIETSAYTQNNRKPNQAALHGDLFNS